MDTNKTCYVGGGRIISAPPADPKEIVEQLDNMSAGTLIRVYDNLQKQTVRDEANAIVAFAFRNGPLEDMHAGEYSADLIENLELSRLTDSEMKQLMLFACEAMEKVLRLRDEDPDVYVRFIAMQQTHFCGEWQR